MQGAASALHAFFDNYLGMYGHLRSHIAAVLYARRTVRHPTSLRRLRQTLDVVGRLLRHDGRSILGGMAGKTKATKRAKSPLSALSWSAWQCCSWLTGLNAGVRCPDSVAAPVAASRSPPDNEFAPSVAVLWVSLEQKRRYPEGREGAAARTKLKARPTQISPVLCLVHGPTQGLWMGVAGARAG